MGDVLFAGVGVCHFFFFSFGRWGDSPSERVWGKSASWDTDGLWIWVEGFRVMNALEMCSICLLGKPTRGGGNNAAVNVCYLGCVTRLLRSRVAESKSLAG